MKGLSHVRLFVTPWTIACQPPPARIFQARILEWVAISFSKGSCQHRDLTQVSCIGGRFITTEPPGKAYSSQEALLKVGPFSHGPCSTRVEDKIEPYFLSLG